MKNPAKKAAGNAHFGPEWKLKTDPNPQNLAESLPPPEKNAFRLIIERVIYVVKDKREAWDVAACVRCFPCGECRVYLRLGN